MGLSVAHVTMVVALQAGAPTLPEAPVAELLSGSIHGRCVYDYHYDDVIVERVNLRGDLRRLFRKGRPVRILTNSGSRTLCVRRALDAFRNAGVTNVTVIRLRRQ